MTRTTRIIALIILIGLFASVASVVFAEGDEGGILTKSLTQTEKAAYGKRSDANTFAKMIGKIINAALSLVGTIFLVLTIYGGFKWMTASGNEEDVTKAKQVIGQAIIGLAVVIAALLITNFVLASLAKATV